MKHQIIVGITICMSLHAFAQTTHQDSASSKPKLQDYIQPMSEFIQLKLTQKTDIEELAVVAAGSTNTSQYISPNANSITHIGLSYKFLSFGYGFIAKFLPGNDDDYIKGKTKGNLYNLNFNFSKWQQELAYGTTKGYYLENTKDYDPNWQEGDPYFQLPNMKFTNIEGMTAYKFNPHYSFNALTTQSERQLRSSGTFMPALLYRYYILDDKTTPTATSTTFKSKSFEILLGAGYYHTFVFKKSFYVGLGAMPAAGYITTKNFATTSTQTTETTANNFIFRWDLRSGLGYNGNRFFAGAYLRAFGAANKQYQGSTAINTDARTAMQIFIGYRLNAPKWLKTKVDQVQTMVPL